MNTQVDFTTAKLLKEKGFNEPCKWYMEDGVTLSESNETNDYLFPGYYSAPTIAEVVMWLYEKYGIWISVYTMETWPNGNERKQLFDYSLKQMRFGLIDIPKKPEEFNTPTEAYESAIEYTLKNLI